MSTATVAYNAESDAVDMSVPADKSLTHRSILCASIAHGKSTITNWLKSEDCMATLKAMSMLGIEVTYIDGSSIQIQGGRFSDPDKQAVRLDLGNSGTAIRLIAGLLVGQNMRADLTGDASLQTRPMDRIIKPLQRMNANIFKTDSSILSVQKSQDLIPLVDYSLEVVSAQVKSCLLLAGLGCQQASSIIEQRPTRKHTEMMLSALDADIHIENDYLVPEQTRLTVKQSRLSNFDCHIPCDPSSAAFFAGFGLLTKRKVCIRNVVLAEQRLGFFRCLEMMNADIHLQQTGEFFTEPVGDITIEPCSLRACDFSGKSVSDGIDEMPMLALLASIAEGTSHFSGLDELRVKESDRIHAMSVNLANQGVELEEHSDGWIIQGLEGRKLAGGDINAFFDHRIAMSFAIASCIAEEPMVISDWEMVASSFPTFNELAHQVGFRINREQPNNH